jgi:protein transport protein YIF1
MPPRDDINAPDMYIPLMALVTYILVSTLLAGLKSAFHPELFGTMASKAIISVALEILLLKGAMYLWLNISSQSQLLDLIAYSGYKFVGVIVTLVVSEIWNRGGGSGGLVGWLVFMYTFLAVAFFLVSFFLPHI